METAKKIDVAIKRRSIIFISVPKSFKITTNFEFENEGIKEKHENKRAVAIAAKDNVPFIASLKLAILEGENFKQAATIHTNTIRVMVIMFLFIRPSFIFHHPSLLWRQH